MANNTVNSKSPFGKMAGRGKVFKLVGVAIVAVVLYMISSVQAGGHGAGFTYIAPGNVGLVIDNYHGVVENQLMSAGTHWQGLWETVIEVPTAQRTITLTKSGSDESGESGAVQVNTISNMLQVDVSAQYNILPEQARSLYQSYQDQFADARRFEVENLDPAVKGAINIAIGDMDTTTALTTLGKNKAENEAKAALNAEWEPRGIVFSNVMIRGIEQDQESKDLLATTLTKMQDIENAKLALQQQQFDNATTLLRATSEAQVNRLKNASLTDLLVQDTLLGRVKKIYLPSDELMGILKQ